MVLKTLEDASLVRDEMTQWKTGIAAGSMLSEEKREA